MGRSFFKAYLLPAAGIFIVVVWLGSVESSATPEHWLFDVLLLIVVPILALNLSGGLLRDEIKDGTLEYLWTRPLKRYQLILGFYLGAVMKGLLYGVSFGAAILIAGWLNGVVPEVELLPRFGLGLLLSVLTFSAGALFLATMTGKYMFIGMVYGFLLEVWLGRLSPHLSQFSISHYIQSVGGFGDVLEPASVLKSTLVCLSLMVVFLAAASAVFTLKEYSLGDEKEA